jgi:circadian clock protein KaiC
VFAFEESQAQTVRNMKSIGVNLEPLIKKNLLVYEASRPTMYGLEMHLVRMHKAIREHNPSLVVIDPISSLMLAGDPREARSTTLRLVDFLKQRGITGIFTNLVGDASHQEQTEISISSLIDTWILLRDIEIGGERNRGLHVLKSRGMAHSNQIREFILTGRGIQLQPVYVGPSGVLTGSARVALEARDQAEELTRQQEAERRRLELQRKCSVLEAQIVALQADLNAERQELERASAEEAGRARMRDQERARIAASRRAQPSRQNKDKNASEAVR